MADPVAFAVFAIVTIGTLTIYRTCRSKTAISERDDTEEILLALQRGGGTVVSPNNTALYEQLRGAIAAARDELRTHQRLRHAPELVDATTRLQELKRRATHHMRMASEVTQRERKRLVALGMDHTSDYNVAHCGRSGEGKSLLCNACRGLRPGDDGAVEVGADNEMPALPTKHVYSAAYPHLVVWDLPGGGTTDNPGETYYYDRCLDLFDVIYVCYTGRFDQLTEHIVTKSRDAGHLDRVVFVYTKTNDSVVRERFNDRISDHEQAYQSLRQRVTADFRSRLARLLDHEQAEAVPLIFVDSMEWLCGRMQFDEMKYYEILCDKVSRRVGAAKAAELLRNFKTQAHMRWAGGAGVY